MRIVLDTNVVVSALIWGGTPDQLIQMAIDGEIVLCSTAELLEELREVLERGHLAPHLARHWATVEAALSFFSALVEMVVPSSVPRVVPQDEDDDQVIAAATAAQADLIVTGDRHLLVLGNHAGIPILTPAAAVALFGVPGAE